MLSLILGASNFTGSLEPKIDSAIREQFIEILRFMRVPRTGILKKNITNGG